MSAYYIVIAACLIIILSYGFSLIARRTSIPSVLMLIGLGIIIKAVLKSFSAEEIDLFPFLEVLGIVGLILIVLEAALDLRITREKRGLILRAFVLAISSLVVNSVLISSILMVYLNADFFHCMIYAIPLSIASSAIIIPSVSTLPEKNREFMIYESAFSDILGIIFFYFLIQTAEMSGFGEISISLLLNILLTLVVSLAFSLGIIFLFPRIQSDAKFFLLIAVLILLYAIGKLFHLSSLVIIMIFGLILENRRLFASKGIFRRIDQEAVNGIYGDLRLITIESSFTVRTFFFVIFGMTIILSSLYNLQVIVVSLMILIVLFGFRYGIFRLFMKKNIMPEAFISPRGLITLLLFYSIPDEFKVGGFNPSVLLFVIIISSIIMAVALIKSRRAKEQLLTSGTVAESNGNDVQATALQGDEQANNETIGDDHAID
ncbi:MAG TPA: cation:proton antiporter [Bacteroidales bacterium]|nr:cation:proton antiporter [Bacteroidales bacterium]